MPHDAPLDAPTRAVEALTIVVLEYCSDVFHRRVHRDIQRSVDAVVNATRVHPRYRRDRGGGSDDGSSDGGGSDGGGSGDGGSGDGGSGGDESGDEGESGDGGESGDVEEGGEGGDDDAFSLREAYGALPLAQTLRVRGSDKEEDCAVLLQLRRLMRTRIDDTGDWPLGFMTVLHLLSVFPRISKGCMITTRYVLDRPADRSRMRFLYTLRCTLGVLFDAPPRVQSSTDRAVGPGTDAPINYQLGRSPSNGPLCEASTEEHARSDVSMCDGWCARLSHTIQNRMMCERRTRHEYPVRLIRGLPCGPVSVSLIEESLSDASAFHEQALLLWIYTEGSRETRDMETDNSADGSYATRRCHDGTKFFRCFCDRPSSSSQWPRMPQRPDAYPVYHLASAERLVRCRAAWRYICGGYARASNNCIVCGTAWPGLPPSRAFVQGARHPFSHTVRTERWLEFVLGAPVSVYSSAVDGSSSIEWRYLCRLVSLMLVTNSSTHARSSRPSEQQIHRVGEMFCRIGCRAQHARGVTGRLASPIAAALDACVQRASLHGHRSEKISAHRTASSIRCARLFGMAEVHMLHERKRNREGGYRSSDATTDDRIRAISIVKQAVFVDAVLNALTSVSRTIPWDVAVRERLDSGTLVEDCTCWKLAQYVYLECQERVFSIRDRDLTDASTLLVREMLDASLSSCASHRGVLSRLRRLSMLRDALCEASETHRRHR